MFVDDDLAVTPTARQQAADDGLLQMGVHDVDLTVAAEPRQREESERIVLVTPQVDELGLHGQRTRVRPQGTNQRLHLSGVGALDDVLDDDRRTAVTQMVDNV